jgi:hypothetical protein
VPTLGPLKDPRMKALPVFPLIRPLTPPLTLQALFDLVSFVNPDLVVRINHIFTNKLDGE